MRLIELSGPPDMDLIEAAWRRRLARGLLRLSAALTRAALALERVRQRRRGPPALEFYAEAGAPEGALYQDGQLVGTLTGVQRL